MGRKNKKGKLVNYENSIKKSNEISMVKLNSGLSLNQMQLLAYTIYSTQQDGETGFIKANFEKAFNLDEYRTEHANEDVKKLYGLGFSLVDLKNNSFDYLRVFQRISYSKGKFSFRWTDDMIPHILELKTYSLIDLTIASKFRSNFSWTLYEYLKAHYAHWHNELSKESLMKLFNVEDRITYQKSTGQFKRGVLDVAIKEINEYTELEIRYEEKKVGNKITGFVLHWSTGKKVSVATEKQLTLLREIHDEVEKNMFDYLSIKDVQLLNQARRYIVAIKEIDRRINKGLSSGEASEVIQKAKKIICNLKDCLKGMERNGILQFILTG